jgi:zinc transport system permease protein
MIELLLLPLFAASIIALVTGPMGCFVVWNRMAYFGDTLAHSALFGVSLALLLNLNLDLGIFFACFLVAGALLFFKNSKVLPRDTLLGIFAHGSLALGIVLASFNKGTGIDLMAFLFGDVLAVNTKDVLLIAGLSTSILAVLLKKWKTLLLISMDTELAQVEGCNVRTYHALLMFLLAGLIAFSIKIIGVLLIGALLIIPAATARIKANTPEVMAIGASLLALSAVFGGLLLSWFADTPAGPSIVLFSFSLFIVFSILFSRKAKLKQPPEIQT